MLLILFIFKHILFHPNKITLPCCILYAGELSITKWYYATEMEACQHHSAQVVVLTQRTPAPAYNAVADSPVRAALQRRGRLAHPPLRSVHASAPAYNAEDNLLVRTGLQCRGRLICLHPWPTRS